jgi:hypothetical protein
MEHRPRGRTLANFILLRVRRQPRPKTLFRARQGRKAAPSKLIVAEAASEIGGKA